MTTPFHGKYWAHELTLPAATGSIESLSRSIAGARVDLNPHQVDAALFAIRSPLTKGTNRVIAMCKKHGVPPPRFEERQGFLIVTFKAQLIQGRDSDSGGQDA